MDKFETAFLHLMVNEGGYSDDPVDIGGKTIFGIASKYHKKWFSDVYFVYKNQGAKAAKILASKFYKEKFWNDKYEAIEDSSIAFRLFDFGVNASVRRSVKLFQKTLNLVSNKKAVKIDGVFGSKTLERCNSLEQERIYIMYCIVIYSFYLKRLTAWKHLRGWRYRLLKRYLLD